MGRGIIDGTGVGGTDRHDQTMKQGITDNATTEQRNKGTTRLCVCEIVYPCDVGSINMYDAQYGRQCAHILCSRVRSIGRIYLPATKTYMRQA